MKLKGNQCNGNHEQTCNQKDYIFGGSKSQNNRKCLAAVFSIPIPVLNILNDFPDKIDKKSKNSRFELLTNAQAALLAGSAGGFGL